MMIDIITSINLHDALLIAHIIGLVIGFGVAISIDYLLLRALLSRRLSPIVIDMAVQAAKLTTFGLVVLWLSGAGFLLEYRELSPEKLDNPKVHAKLIIVVILTLNGFLIHRFILPILWRFSGKDVLNVVPVKTLFLFSCCAAVSTVSWVFPIVFGLHSALNFSYSAAHLLAQYAFFVVLGVSILFFALSMWRRHSSSISVGGRRVRHG